MQRKKWGFRTMDADGRHYGTLLRARSKAGVYREIDRLRIAAEEGLNSIAAIKVVVNTGEGLGWQLFEEVEFKLYRRMDEIEPGDQVERFGEWRPVVELEVEPHYFGAGSPAIRLSYRMWREDPAGFQWINTDTRAPGFMERVRRPVTAVPDGCAANLS